MNIRNIDMPDFVTNELGPSFYGVPGRPAQGMASGEPADPAMPDIEQTFAFDMLLEGVRALGASPQQMRQVDDLASQFMNEGMSTEQIARSILEVLAEAKDLAGEDDDITAISITLLNAILSGMASEDQSAGDFPHSAWALFEPLSNGNADPDNTDPDNTDLVHTAGTETATPRIDFFATSGDLSSNMAPSPQATTDTDAYGTGTYELGLNLDASGDLTLQSQLKVAGHAADLSDKLGGIEVAATVYQGDSGRLLTEFTAGDADSVKFSVPESTIFALHTHPSGNLNPSATDFSNQIPGVDDAVATFDSNGDRGQMNVFNTA